MNFRSSLLLSACLVLSACRSVPPPSRDAAPEYDSTPSYPHWSGRAVTWTKLADIETWLDGPGPREYPHYVPKAELELAEGRLGLAKREASGLTPPVLAARLEAAEKGFVELLRRRDLEAGLRLRAEQGLDEIAALRPKVATQKPTSAPSRASAVPAGLAIQLRGAWRAANAVRARLSPSIEGWNRITIHHSAKESDGGISAANGNVADVIHKIQTFHIRERGWGDIGYHFLIDAEGGIWQGRLLDWQGAHAQGTNNVGNIGICLLGDYSKSRPDPRALAALERLVDALCERHQIAHNRVYGHLHFAKTECPGDALMAWVARYTAGATH